MRGGGGGGNIGSKITMTAREVQWCCNSGCEIVLVTSWWWRGDASGGMMKWL
jgi:hypothetical protein